MTRTITWDEIEKHGLESNLWIVLDNKVYDVSKYIHEHPGGEEILLEQAGLDATQAFEDIGHSEDARSLLKDFYIGDVSGPKPKVKDSPKKQPARTPETAPSGKSAIFWIFSLIVLAIAGFIGTSVYAPELLPEPASAFIKEYLPILPISDGKKPASKFGKTKPFPSKSNKKPAKGKKSKN